MKKLSAALLLLSVLAAFAGNVPLPFSIDPKIPRKIVIGKTPVLTLTPGNFEIVEGQKTPTVKLAAKEIADALSGVFGVTVTPVEKSSGKAAVSVRVGDMLLARELGIDPARFDRDGFVIRTAGNKVLIIGRDLPDCDPLRRVNATAVKGEWGTLFGAYDFLERFAGIRYYFPGRLGTCIPKAKQLSLPAVDIYDRPDFLQRRFNDYNYGRRPIRRYPGWNGPLNKLRNRVETIYIPNCHGLFYLSYHKRFGKSHPEYFALNANGRRMTGGFSDKDAQLCLSSALKQEIVRDAVSFLKNEPASVRGVLDRHGKVGWNKIHVPGMPCFNIMPNDSAYHCRCPECWKHFSKGPQATTDFFWQFFIDISNDVKKSGAPGYLTTMAYATYKRLPSQKIPDNLLVMLALRGPWNEFAPARQAADIALLKAWYGKLGQKTWLWTYPGKYKWQMPGIPHTTPRALSGFIKKARPYIFGLYIECESDVVLFNYLVYHVFGKLAWDPSADVEKLLDEHAKNLYGPAAEPMKAFFDAVEKNWGRIAANVVETAEGPKSVYPSELVLWGEIYSPAELKRLSGLFDEAEKRAARDALALERVRFIRKEMLGPILAEAEKFRAANDAATSWNFPMKAFEGSGAPSEKDWAGASVFHLAGFQGAPSEVPTTVRVLYDAENFYFRFDCGEPETEKIRAFKRPFDQKDVWRDSDVELFISPDGDRKHYYQLLLNAAGSSADLECTAGGAGRFAWNSGAKTSAKIIPGKGWRGEIVLPRRSMRKAAPEGILVNFSRHRVLKSEKPAAEFYTWNPFVRGLNEVSRFGRLRFGAAPEANLLRDPEFTGTGAKKSWILSKNASTDTAFFITGGRSLRLKGTPGGKEQAVQYLKLKPGIGYEISFFLKLELTKGSFDTRLDFGGGGSVNYPPQGAMLSGKTPWKKLTFRARTPAAPGGKRRPYLRFTLRGGPGTAWVDHVRMTELPGAPEKQGK